MRKFSCIPVTSLLCLKKSEPMCGPPRVRCVNWPLGAPIWKPEGKGAYDDFGGTEQDGEV